MSIVEQSLGGNGEVAATMPADGQLWKKSDKVKRALRALAEEVLRVAVPHQVSDEITPGLDMLRSPLFTFMWDAGTHKQGRVFTAVLGF